VRNGMASAYVGDLYSVFTEEDVAKGKVAKKVPGAKIAEVGGLALTSRRKSTIENTVPLAKVL
jgi:hypothetical protein